MTQGRIDLNYPKSDIRRSWRFFRFWTYWFNGQTTRAMASLIFSDETFGQVAKALKRSLAPCVNLAPLSPWTRLVEYPEPSPPAPEEVTFISLPSKVEVADLERLHSALIHSDSLWTFVSTEGSDWTDVQRAAAIALARGEDFDLLYTDELYTSELLPTLRPHRIGPHTLLSGNAIGRHYLLSNSAAQSVGGLRTTHGTATEFDLFLRLAEVGSRFGHYEFLINTPAPDIAPSELLEVTRASLTRRGFQSLQSEGTVVGVVNWAVYSLEPVSVEILIPTRDRVDLLRQCIEQIERTSTYSHFSITILNNDSVDPETLEYLATTTHRVIDCPGEFNYARIINHGAQQSHADFLVMLNNDTLIKTSNWLELLLGAALLDDVGVVGAKIMDQNNSIEHSGIAIAPYPQHIRYGVNVPASWNDFAGIRNVSAVTGALHMISKAKWVELGGMDEDLAVLLNDVDLCMRAELKGWHTVVQPSVTVQHFVSSSRGRLNPKLDRDRFIAHWDIFRGYEDRYFPAAASLYANRLVLNAKTSQLLRWSEVLKALFSRG